MFIRTPETTNQVANDKNEDDSRLRPRTSIIEAERTSERPLPSLVSTESNGQPKKLENSETGTQLITNCSSLQRNPIQKSVDKIKADNKKQMKSSSNSKLRKRSGPKLTLPAKSNPAITKKMTQNMQSTQSHKSQQSSVEKEQFVLKFFDKYDICDPKGDNQPRDYVQTSLCNHVEGVETIMREIESSDDYNENNNW